MSIFQYTDYKKFVNDRIKDMPKQGRGEFQRLAAALTMHSTTVSHVFKGDKDLTLEQTAGICQHWGLNPNESDYFVTMVELTRAGSPTLKKIFQTRLDEIKKSSVQLKSRIPKDIEMTEVDRSKFYSQWYFSAVRLLCDIPEYRTIDRIAQHLNIPVGKVNEVIQFLLQSGLITEEKGKFKLGPSRTYVSAESTLVHRHHGNWRVKAMDLYPRMNIEEEFALTSPMTISNEDAIKVRELLMKSVEKILAINKPSQSEELRILNIDWLKI
ncbi:TIGR02147 family protein [Bdellovibrio sp. HCB290]|uniref:TIGR02147 family protein n=1 Tax=Bdellovibrio sp. HCB290 TaxID=3394356 RepID=UPI0039B483C4